MLADGGVSVTKNRTPSVQGDCPAKVELLRQISKTTINNRVNLRVDIVRFTQTRTKIMPKPI